MSSALPAPELAATWSAAGQGEGLWFLGTLAIVRVPGEAVDGRFALIEFLFPRHASPPLHTHPQDESYIVLDGQLTVQAGADRFELDADGTAQLAFEVSALNLLGGDYDLALGAGHGAEAALAERTIRFSVAREEGPEGIVALDGSWRSMPAAEKRA